MKLSAKDLLKVADSDFLNRDVLKGRKITGVSTDSRTVTEGDLFVAIKGERFDGHEFVEQSFAAGARAAMVSVDFDARTVPGKPLVVVQDTVKALGRLARLYRDRFSLPIIAIAGSNGKTTTKEMMVPILSAKYRVLATEGNFNNHIGVPHTLFRLQKKHDLAIIELGTNHPGEVRSLCDMVDPTHGLVTNIGREHLEFFKTVEGVADEEGGLFEYLAGRKKSVALVNADDEWIASKSRSVRKRITYGLAARRVDVRGKVLGTNDTGCVELAISLKKRKKKLTVQLAVPGEHNAINVLAAAAAGVAFRVPAKRIRKALESFSPVSKRMELLNFEGVVVYNDTYNANPDSMLAALRTLAGTAVPGKKIAVLADMRELGDAAVSEHVRIGQELANMGIQYVLTYGELARHIKEASAAPYAMHYEQKNMLSEYLAELIAPGDAVLVKGSRSMKMEDVVAFLEQRLRTAIVPFG